MASSIIINDAVQGETFLPGQIFVFGGFALRANSLGHLEQIESYAPGRQVKFGSLNFTADIRGDLIFDGFEPQPSALHCHDACAASKALFGGRAISCPSRQCGALGCGSNPSKIKSPRISAVYFRLPNLT